MAVVGELPVEGVDFLLGSVFLGETVIVAAENIQCTDELEAQRREDMFLACAVTRSMAQFTMHSEAECSEARVGKLVGKSATQSRDAPEDYCPEAEIDGDSSQDGSSTLVPLDASRDSVISSTVDDTQHSNEIAHSEQLACVRFHEIESIQLDDSSI